ncbi:hypothetical protein ACC717_04970 [Rhizobium ruizarguesonis]
MHRTYRFLHALYDVLASIAFIVADFARACLRVDYGYAWRSMTDLGIAAYRKIGDLRPVYRESYDTHGLSLDHRWRAC